MSTGHRNVGGGTQNQGNVLGDRPCVRQSRLFREHEGGNAMKELMGQNQLIWDKDQLQGAYHGQRVYDHDRGKHVTAPQQQQQQQHYRQPQQQQHQSVPSQAAHHPQPQQQQEQAPPQHRPRGRGGAHAQTFNIFSHDGQ